MIVCICLFNFTLYLDAFKKYILQDCLLYTRDHVSSLMRTSRTARYNNDDFDTVFDRWPNGILRPQRSNPTHVISYYKNNCNQLRFVIRTDVDGARAVIKSTGQSVCIIGVGIGFGIMPIDQINNITLHTHTPVHDRLQQVSGIILLLLFIIIITTYEPVYNKIFPINNRAAFYVADRGLLNVPHKPTICVPYCSRRTLTARVLCASKIFICISLRGRCD